jgi:hypothetical protein
VSKPRNPTRILAFFCIYFAIAVYLNTRFPSIPAGAPSAFTVAVCSLWLAVRDWPWRAYYIGATVAVAIAFTASAAVGGVLDSSLTLAAMFFAIGTSMVPIGLLDHRLLVRLIQEARSPEAAAAADRPGLPG